MNQLVRVVALGMLLGGCSEPPPPKPPPIEEPEPPPPPPPPKPTCKAMKDRCKAEQDTVVPIPELSLVFVPPADWEYAMLEEASVTQVGEEGPVLVLASYEAPKSPTKVNDARLEIVLSMAELVGIEAPSKLTFERPTSRKLAGLPMKLWERTAKRSGASGALLILETHLDKRELLGVGFAPEGDKEGTKKILATLETFRDGDEKPEPDADDGEGDDKGKGK